MKIASPINGKQASKPRNKPLNNPDDPDNPLVTDKQKAERLGDHYQHVSSDAFLDPNFAETKRTTEEKESHLFEQEPTNIEDYNSPITLKELNQALNNKKDSSPGHDNITYSMLKNLPHNYKEEITRLFNQIWTEGKIPKKYKIV